MQAQSEILQVEFSRVNKAIILKPILNKINFVKLIQLSRNEERQNDKLGLIVNVYSIENKFSEQTKKIETQFKIICGILVDDIGEDLKTLDIDYQREELYIAGDLGLIHCVSLIKGTFLRNNPKFLLSCSDDFSCRIWDAQRGIQMALFLDIEEHNSEIICIDWAPDFSSFLSFGNNQHLRVWDLDKRIKLHFDKVFLNKTIFPFNETVLKVHFPSHVYFQGILDSVSNIILHQHYLIQGDVNGDIYAHNLKCMLDDERKTQKIAQVFKEEKLQINHLSQITFQGQQMHLSSQYIFSQTVIAAANNLSNKVSVNFVNLD
ncbi:wd40 domain-binding protein [Stylonychia lemnae]|uniref:Wd40 domain-binding protein n=1 Tax=Stylonychia lemnae TaxID=5949 RepID=A0A078AYI9_STYLE|nr:wd40 domain-binding protein [Stylonychia lemnae]|eukprot:CDW87196.1 wd40 domain-binding protein [Stylonychia lemnae]